MAEVEIKGIRELRGAFKAVDADIPKQLKAEFMGIAQDVVRAVSGTMPRRSGKAIGSLRARASTTGAGIAFGGTAAPYFPWLDFGGSTGKGHRPGVSGSGSVKRDMIGGGRYVYPTIAAKGADIERAAEEAVIRAAKRAQFEAR